MRGASSYLRRFVRRPHHPWENVTLNDASRSSTLLSLDRYRLAVTKNRASARRAGVDKTSGGRLSAGIMRVISASR